MELMKSRLLLLALVAGLSSCAPPADPLLVQGTAVMDVFVVPKFRSLGALPYSGAPTYRAWYHGVSEVRAYRVGAWRRGTRIEGPLQVDQAPLATGVIDPKGHFSIELPGRVSVQNEGTLEAMISGIGMTDIQGCSAVEPLRVSKANVKVADVRLAATRGNEALPLALDNWRGFEAPGQYDVAMNFYVFAPEPVRAESKWSCVVGDWTVRQHVKLPLRQGWNTVQLSLRSPLAVKGKHHIDVKLTRTEQALPTWIAVASRGYLAPR